MRIGVGASPLTEGFTPHCLCHLGQFGLKEKNATGEPGITLQINILRNSIRPKPGGYNHLPTCTVLPLLTQDTLYRLLMPP